MNRMNMKLKSIRLGIVAAVLSLSVPTNVALAQEVNVLSHRQPFLIQPLFDAFTAQTGIRINTVFSETGLVERLIREGRNSPADLILTVDISRLDEAYGAGVTQPVSNPILEAAIPPQFRGPDGNWWGLTTRARVVYASKDRVGPGEVRSYEDLADPKWRGRICTRSGSHVYQIGLISAMIDRHGREFTKDWLEAVKANLARRPQGNDRAQVRAISEGVCDISLGNSYYFGQMLADREQRDWALATNVLFPTLGGVGTHVNISGMALTASSPNRDSAIKLMEFLVGDDAQRLYAEDNFEYPIKEGVPWAALLQELGRFPIDDIDLTAIAANSDAAQRLVDEVGYDE
jgi:iron(III) transport system substrate-binding protein